MKKKFRSRSNFNVLTTKSFHCDSRNSVDDFQMPDELKTTHSRPKFIWDLDYLFVNGS